MCLVKLCRMQNVCVCLKYYKANLVSPIALEKFKTSKMLRIRIYMTLRSMSGETVLDDERFVFAFVFSAQYAF